jgi:hypothetical protein
LREIDKKRDWEDPFPINNLYTYLAS